MSTRMTPIEAIPGLFVGLSAKPGGDYEIAAQHLRGGDEYEYWITIAASDAGRFAEALGTDAAGIPAAWQSRVQEIALTGETAWLKRHGIPYRFDSWGHVDL